MLVGQFAVGAAYEQMRQQRRLTPPQPQTDQANISLNRVTPDLAPTLDLGIYREIETYPIDPRKPASPCFGLDKRCKSGLGNGGQPQLERVSGGCQCDQRRPWRGPDFSVHWPRPFSVKLDTRFPGLATQPNTDCSPRRPLDRIDGLSSFKLINYQRSDNGYCGPGADRFGCLGESKLQAIR